MKQADRFRRRDSALSASRRTFTNYEFAMPGRFSTGLEGHFIPGDEFPFTYETLTDPISKKTDGWLMRCRQQKACPKIMHWDSGTESWQGETRWSSAIRWQKKTCRYRTTCGSIIFQARSTVRRKNPNAACVSN